jgi:hypothetical protein
MRFSIKHLLVVVFFSFLGHLMAIYSGLYESGVSIDKVLHVIGGLLFAVAWILVLQKYFKNDSLILKSISIVLFSVFGGFLWEVFEFILLVCFNNLALVLKVWASTVSDALMDIAYGMLGASLLAFLYYRGGKPV